MALAYAALTGCVPWPEALLLIKDLFFAEGRVPIRLKRSSALEMSNKRHEFLLWSWKGQNVVPSSSAATAAAPFGALARPKHESPHRTVRTTASNFAVSKVYEPLIARWLPRAAIPRKRLLPEGGGAMNHRRTNTKKTGLLRRPVFFVLSSSMIHRTAAFGSRRFLGIAALGSQRAINGSYTLETARLEAVMQTALSRSSVFWAEARPELGAAVAVELDGTTFCPFHDHRGNIVTLVDVSTQKTFETYRYTAFGEEQVFDSNNASATAHNPWGFVSKRTDPETGFVFFGRRYSPHAGRFATPDPVGFSDGPNLYAYVHNSPVVLVDPYGLTAVEDEADTDDWTRSRSNEEIWKLIHGFEAIPEIGREFIHGDFSRIRDAPWREIAERVASESTEALYCAAAMYPATRIAGAAIRAGGRCFCGGGDGGGL